MPRRIPLALALLVAGCAAAPAGPTSTTEMVVLAWGTPDAVLDSVAAWVATEDDLALDRQGPTAVLRDQRPGVVSETVVEAAPRVGGYSEVRVASRYVRDGEARDLGTRLYIHRAFGRGAYVVPLRAEPGCTSPQSWVEAGPPAPPEPRDRPPGPVEEVAPQLIGGLRGLAARVVYPPALVDAGLSGTVLVQLVVTEEGEVECPVALSAPHPDFAEAAIAAVRASAFRPGRQAGQPVRVRYMVPVTFR